jgi:hypothetical protein
MTGKPLAPGTAKGKNYLYKFRVFSGNTPNLQRLFRRWTFEPGYHVHGSPKEQNGAIYGLFFDVSVIARDRGYLMAWKWGIFPAGTFLLPVSLGSENYLVRIE